MAEKKHFSLSERLAMTNTQQMEVGNTYFIKKVNSVIEFADKKTGDIRRAVIVDCEDGQYYLPNTIANGYLEELASGKTEAEVNAIFEGHTFKCESFTAKSFGTKGKTLHLIA